jgi:glycosyltransferase involved in cell wall biosynthesis
MKAPELSIVVPTYGGRDSLAPLLQRLRVTLERRPIDYEVIIVNDASPDGTWSVLGALAQEHPELHAIDLLNNHGQPVATVCGLHYARGELIATMDDDLQHPPEELPKLLDALEAHPEWDAVVGSWSRDEGRWRDFGSIVHQVLDRLAHGTPMDFRHSGFRLMRRPAVRAIVDHQTRAPVVGPLLKQVARRVHNVEVAHHDREFGRSGFTVAEGVRHVLTNFMHGTALPLRMLSRFGVLCSAFAVLIGSFFIVRWMLGFETPPGWASNFLATIFFGGATLFGVGILGEYTHLVLREARQPPRWNVRGEIDPAPGVDEP